MRTWRSALSSALDTRWRKFSKWGIGGTWSLNDVVLLWSHNFLILVWILTFKIIFLNRWWLWETLTQIGMLWDPKYQIPGNWDFFFFHKIPKAKYRNFAQIQESGFFLQNPKIWILSEFFLSLWTITDFASQTSQNLTPSDRYIMPEKNTLFGSFWIK